ncbi:hypothetical protein ABZW30_18580 [Kitasatospora sp. NPDC004669]|uniref:hypothetical protein n=1 Tax=Kitasatospora sp. NPDC004669 TaxID=3154555 RepID=UPI0033B83C86
MLIPTTANLIERIEAVRITDPLGWHAWMDGVPGETIGFWEDAQEVLALVAALPAGTRMRCFTPGFALRAHAGRHPVFPEQVLFEIAFCFRCQGAWLYGPAVTKDLAHQTFDPDSIPARELLLRFRGENGPRVG